MTALRPLLLAPCLLVLAAPADRPTFAPEAGSSVHKTLEVSLAFRLDDFTLSYAGQEITPEMLGDLPGQFTGEMSVGVTETYVKTADGRPLQLLRAFDDLGLELSDGSESHDLPGFDELEGKTVRFVWSEDDGEYTVSFVDDEGDDALLDGLSDDMDLRLLLPEEEVSADATWQVESSKLFPLFFPGGIVHPSSEGGEDEVGALLVGQLQEQLLALIEDLEVRCTYKGTHSDDDVEVAEIGIAYDGQGSVDLADLITEIADTQEDAPDLSDLSASLDLTFRGGEGTLSWNMDAGRAQSFEMSSTLEVSIAVEVTLSAEGQTVPIALDADLSGEVEWSLDAAGR